MMLGRGKKRNYQQVVTSPDGQVNCEFELVGGVPFYRVWKGDRDVMARSRLGLMLEGEGVLGENMTLVRVHRKSYDETWETMWGETATIRNHYNEAAFYLTENETAHKLMVVRVRVFDEGAAFRLEIPAQPKFRRVVIAEELTEFNLHPNSYIWQIPAFQPDRYEYLYERTEVQLVEGSIHTPATVELPNGLNLALHEAVLYDYGAMTLQWCKGAGLKADITPRSDGCVAKVDLPWATPWRVLMVGNSPLDLVTNRMVLNLNPAPTRDFSWVKPLKFMGIWWAMFVGEWTWAPGEKHGATTEHAREYIKDCEKFGVRGLLVEGWNNGWEGDWLQNGATTNFTQPQEDFDLPAVAKYAREHNVELIGHHETVGYIDNYERQLSAAYGYYAENGVHYVKSGYANSRMTLNGRKEFHHSQIGVRHYQKAVELAAQYGIMLDVHEPIKGTGIERTWPNLMTREGARGQEYAGGKLGPEHACILPFTRLLAGGMDYTPGIFDITNEKRRVDSTLARQLAYYVVIYSSMQMAADRPKMYKQYPEAFRFIQEVPVSWRETVPLVGEIGRYYAVARQDRESEDWYIGAVTNEEGRNLGLKLDFLGEGEWRAVIYKDGPAADFRTNPLEIEIEERSGVKAGDVLDVWLAPGGGAAIKLYKV